MGIASSRDGKLVRKEIDKLDASFRNLISEMLYSQTDIQDCLDDIDGDIYNGDDTEYLLKRMREKSSRLNYQIKQALKEFERMKRIAVEQTVKL